MKQKNSCFRNANIFVVFRQQCKEVLKLQ